jgi:hypothetical protein
MREGAGKLRLLENCSRSGEENLDLAAADPLERFHALAGDLGVRLGFAKTFTGRVKRDESCISQRFEIGEPSLRSGDTFGDNDEKSALTGVRHGCDRNGVAGTRQA